MVQTWWARLCKALKNCDFCVKSWSQCVRWSIWFSGVLKDALQISDDAFDPRTWSRRRRRWAQLWGLVILLGVSFALLALGDKFSAEGLALTRFMARAQAPVTGQFVYPETARDKITVVLYDRQYLQDNGSAWPLTYQEHADALLRLVADPAARPKAILLDVTFGQQRNDPTITLLRQAFCSLQNDFKVPVFLAALPSPEDGKLTVRDGLGGPSSDLQATCFTLVGVDYIPDALDGVAWTYLMTRHRTEAGWQAGPPSGTQPAYRSAALAIAQDAGAVQLGEETVPMALVWGHNSAAQGEAPLSLKDCRAGQSQWSSVLPGFLRSLFASESEAQALCPYHRTLSMSQISELPEVELAPLLKDRYVMVGANVPGYNDFANSPVHGTLPGIHMHAMALDNLLTYGDRYKLNAEWSLSPSLALVIPGLIAVATVFLVHLLLTRLRRLTRRRRKEWILQGKNRGCTATLAWLEAPHPKPLQRCAQIAAGVLGWLLRILLQAMAAFAMLAFLQYFFRIGMLPVAELIGMTLVAEGLGVMKKLREAALGPLKQAN